MPKFTQNREKKQCMEAGLDGLSSLHLVAIQTIHYIVLEERVYEPGNDLWYEGMPSVKIDLWQLHSGGATHEK